MEGRAWVAWLTILFGGGALVLLIAFSITEGTAEIPPPTVWDVLLHFNRQDTHHLIIVDLRLSRVPASALVGAAFAVMGAVMQGVTRSPITDSRLMGLNAGASFVLPLCFILFLGLSYLQLALFSFAGTALGAGLTSSIVSLRCGGTPSTHLVLARAVVSVLPSTLSQGITLYFNVAQDIMFWTTGNVAGSTWPQIRIMTPWIMGALLGAIAFSYSISIMSLDENVAKGLGLNALLIRILCIAVVLVPTGASVAVVGSVGFVGLVVPHVAQFLVGRNYRWVTPASAVLGSLLVVLTDLGAGAFNPPSKTPIGAVIAPVDVPFFLYLARRERRALW